MGLSGVVTLLSGDAASRPPLTLIPKPHPPLLWLLDDLYEGVCCLDWRTGGSERRRRNVTRLQCFGNTKAQYLDQETLAFYAALLESVCRHRNNSVNVYQSPCLLMSSLHSIDQYWFIQNTDNLLEVASYLGWVSSRSIHTRLWWTENKNRRLTDWLKSPWVIGGLPSTLHDTQRQHRQHKPKSCFQHILVV